MYILLNYKKHTTERCNRRMHKNEKYINYVNYIKTKKYENKM